MKRIKEFFAEAGDLLWTFIRLASPSHLPRWVLNNHVVYLICQSLSYLAVIFIVLVIFASLVVFAVTSVLGWFIMGVFAGFTGMLFNRKKGQS